MLINQQVYRSEGAETSFMYSLANYYSMWVATTITVIGLLSVATITQFTGFRLGGTITVPVLTMYTVKNFLMLPLFVSSTIISYIGLLYLRKRTLIYGRQEFLSAIAIGIIVPLTVIFAVLQGLLDTDVSVLLGSILPGLAAYNFHRVKPEFRRKDLLATIGLFSVLFILGVLLISPRIAPILGEVTPPILFAETSDIAVYRGAVVGISTEDVVVPRLFIASLFVFSLVISERIRSKFGIRVGIITSALLSVYALTNYWLIVMYLILLAIVFGLVQLINYTTLRYGRVLLGTTTAFGFMISVPITLLLPINRGLSAFFIAILAGVTAYNAHVTGSFDRRMVIPAQSIIFFPALIVGRFFGEPGELGFPQELTIQFMVISLLIVSGSLLLLYWYSVDKPKKEEVLSQSVISSDEK